MAGGAAMLLLGGWLWFYACRYGINNWQSQAGYIGAVHEDDDRGDYS